MARNSGVVLQQEAEVVILASQTYQSTILGHFH